MFRVSSLTSFFITLTSYFPHYFVALILILLTSALVSVIFWEELSPANLHVNRLSSKMTEMWEKK